MNVFRLCRSKYSSDLSGKGAEVSGGRWNSKGTPIIYTSESRALCLAEIAVNISLDFLPSDYTMVNILIHDDLKYSAIEMKDLPSDWQSFPHSRSTQVLGDIFVRDSKSPVMKVPSVVVPGEFNFLINPLHASNSSIRIISIDPFRFDERLKIKSMIK